MNLPPHTSCLTYLDINLDHITHNIAYIRSKISNLSLLCGVVKANAYGHGLLPVAKHLLSIGVDRLAVVDVNDLVALREAGITIPIHLMGVIHPHDRKLAISLQAIPFISSIEEISGWAEDARVLEKKLFVHLKINSHMNRLGANKNEIHSLLTHIHDHSSLYLEGIAMHLAQADTKDNSNMLIDLEYLRSLRNELAPSYPNLIYNIASSLAIENYPNSFHHMVRPGIAIYGYELNHLKPVLSWISHVVSIRKVPMNSPVSYGATYTTTQETYLAVIPVGYAEGYPREWQQQVYVLINNQRYPVVGRVCMNQLIVNLGIGHEVKLFDKAYLIHPTLLTAQELAQASGTISYRILTSLHYSLPRFYSSISQEK